MLGLQELLSVPQLEDYEFEQWIVRNGMTKKERKKTQ